MRLTQNPDDSESGRLWPAWRGQAHDLEQRTHLALADQPVARRHDRLGLLRSCGCKIGRAGLYPPSAQELALPDRPQPARLARLRDPGERSEIDVGAEVRIARRGKRIDAAVVAHRLERAACLRLGMAIVDEQRRPALRDQPPGNLEQDCREAPEGTIVETCPAAAAIVSEVAGRLVAQGGAALFIDYGYAEPQTGSTLQAVRDHRSVDPFAAPGESDLSAHVDFSTLVQIAQSRGARWLGTVGQGQFLRSLGIEARAASLAAAAPQRAQAIMAARDRLIDEGEMGTLFKVMGLAAPHWPESIGL